MRPLLVQVGLLDQSLQDLEQSNVFSVQVLLHCGLYCANKDACVYFGGRGESVTEVIDNISFVKYRSHRSFIVNTYSLQVMQKEACLNILELPVTI